MNKGISESHYNRVFIEKTATPEGLEDVRSETQTFIRNSLKEKEFTRSILPPEFVVPSDCDRSADHDELVKVVWPDKDTVIKVTIGIVISTAILSSIFVGVDYSFRMILDLIY